MGCRGKTGGSRTQFGNDQLRRLDSDSRYRAKAADHLSLVLQLVQQTLVQLGHVVFQQFELVQQLTEQQPMYRLDLAVKRLFDFLWRGSQASVRQLRCSASGTKLSRRSSVHKRFNKRRASA
jgi:hypothetical protein